MEEAVAAHREALKEQTRDRVPLDWATTQDNLGGALFILGNTFLNLGERESGTRRLKEAVVAFREALKELTPDRVPLEWAKTQNNLGTTLRRLGECESSTKRIEEAITAYKAALEVFEVAQATHYVEIAKSNLRRSEALLSKRQK